MRSRSIVPLGVLGLAACASPMPAAPSASADVAAVAPSSSAPSPRPAAPSKPATAMSPAIDMRPVGMSMEGFPTPVDGHTAVWTGQVVIFWGGDEAFAVESNGYAPVQPKAHADGKRYDPRRDQWLGLPDAPVAPRFDHVATWTGTQMLVWGGRDAKAAHGDGAAFDPADSSWQRLSGRGAPSRRTRPAAVWTGTEWVIAGGVSASGRPRAGAYAYDPAADRWRELGQLSARAPHGIVWTGDELIVWGGATAGGPIGERFVDGRWRPLPTDGAPPDRSESVVAFAGGLMIVWGGFADDEDPVATGASFDPRTNRWTPLSSAGAIARSSPEFVVVDELVAVLGEPVEPGPDIPSLSLYNATEDRWWAVEGPYPSTGIAMTFTGTEIVAWGGHDGTNMSPTGERVRLR